MSRLFGPVRQAGYVVADIDVAIRWWIEVAQVGPWFRLDRVVLPPATVHGIVRDDMQLSAAFANWGDLQIELIAQHCQTPSVYQGFAGERGGTLHHWSSWPAPEQYEIVYRQATAAGFRCEMEVGVDHGAFSYFAAPGGGPFFEMASLVPWRAAFFEKVRLAACEWDGRDPIRNRHGVPM